MQPAPSDAELVERLVFECLEAEDLEAALAAVRAAHPRVEARVRQAVERLSAQGLLSEVAAPSRVPERLGPFRILRELGAGGMGVVYLAEQEDLGRQVALKLIRPEQLYFPGSRERFRREVEAVARLQHAGIVSVFTVGEEEGLPYFAMEYVEGCSLASVLHAVRDADPATLTGSDLAAAVQPAGDAGAAGSGTGSRRRIIGQPWTEVCVDVAVRIADALQHAHDRGVLHRDVKPSNILITADGRARLVDFGLARTEGAQQLTRTATQIGSLPYMAPEQLDERTAIPTVRLDVYSLGVTLYEMLALRSPFLGPTSEETRRRILEARPESLRQRNTAVRWDLETVCLTAMDPDPAQRYPSIGDLLRDLENVRQRRPIEARRPGLWIRVRRWEQRHPTAVAVAGVVIVLVAVAAVLFGVFESAARHEADRLTREAERRATEAGEVTRFLVDLFRYASPDVSLGQDLPVRTLLQQGAERIDRELQGQPEVSARLLQTFGRVYSWLDENGRAAGFFGRAADRLAQVRGAADPEVLDLRVRVAAEMLAGGDLAGAEATIAGVEAGAGDLGPADRLWPRIQQVRGRLAALRGDMEEAERLYRAVLSSQRGLDVHPLFVTDALRNLATFLGHTNRFEEARPILEECLALLQETCPPGHPAIVAALHYSARNLSRLGQYDLAKERATAAVAQAERIYGSDHPAIAGPLTSLAGVYRDAGQIDDAVGMMRRVLAIAEEYGKYSKNFFARTLNDLAINYQDLGRYAEARRLFERALAASREMFAGDHVLTAFLLQNLSEALGELGETAAAEEHARAGMEMIRRLAPEGPEMPRALAGLAWALIQRGAPPDLKEAARHLDDAIRIGARWPAARWELGRAHASRALLANFAGAGLRAEAAAREALEHFAAVRHADHPSKAMALYQLAWAQLTQGNRAGAEVSFQASIAMFERMGQGYPAKAWPLNHYGFALLDDRPAEAVPLLEEALAIRRRTLPKGSRWRLITTLNLGVAYGNLKRYEDAEPLLLEVHESVLAMSGEKSPEAVASARRLVRLYEGWGKPERAAGYKRIAAGR